MSGVQPDIKVINSFVDKIKGRDPQVDRVVAVTGIADLNSFEVFVFSFTGFADFFAVMSGKKYVLFSKKPLLIIHVIKSGNGPGRTIVIQVKIKREEIQFKL